MVTIYDSGILPGGTNVGWTDHATNGKNDIVDFCKEMSHAPDVPTFNEVGSQRDGIQGLIGLVFQVEFQVYQSGVNDVFGLFGLRDDEQFLVTGPMIYGLINNTTGFPLNVQTFPSGTRLNLTLDNWYTLKLKVLKDQVKVYLHGGPEKYVNAVLGVGPHTAIETASISANINVAATPDPGFIKWRNYFVTDSMQFTPSVLDTSVQKEAWLLKQFYAKPKLVKKPA